MLTSKNAKKLTEIALKRKDFLDKATVILDKEITTAANSGYSSVRKTFTTDNVSIEELINIVKEEGYDVKYVKKSTTDYLIAFELTISW